MGKTQYSALSSFNYSMLELRMKLDFLLKIAKVMHHHLVYKRSAGLLGRCALLREVPKQPW